MSSNNTMNALNCPLRNPTLHITTHNEKGQATVHRSSPGKVIQYPKFTCLNVNIYATSTQPASLTNDTDLQKSETIISKSPMPIVQANGIITRFVDIGPGNLPMMHRTESLDYLVIVEGSLIMLLDDGSETLLEKGDAIIQRATMHAWRNPSETEWARIFAVIQDVGEFSVGGKGMEENLGTGEGEGGWAAKIG